MKKTIALTILALAAVAVAETTDALWWAICIQESNRDPRAVNLSEGAVGIAQIRPICLRDVNRIARLAGSADQFTLADRLSPEYAKMAEDRMGRRLLPKRTRRLTRPATARSLRT